MRLEVQDESALRDHMFSTYLTLRYGIAVLGIAFPVLLWLVGRLVYGIELQPSMSHYYFAPYPENPSETTFPMRVWFVGPLFAIGVGLFLYKGFTNWENVALNLAGIFAVLVALFPKDIDCQTDCGVSLHGTFAVLLFVCLAFVSWFCAEATLDYLPPDPALRTKFRRRYKFLAVLMVVSPLAAYVITVVTNDRNHFIFIAEAFGVWAFAAYWWVKSQEMAISRAEIRALEAKIRPPTKQSGMILPRFSVEPGNEQASS